DGARRGRPQVKKLKIEPGRIRHPARAGRVTKAIERSWLAHRQLLPAFSGPTEAGQVAKIGKCILQMRHRGRQIAVGCSQRFAFHMAHTV
ncbi:MAG: hypothetical protein QOC89_5263, partial [Paraburkholderia sp.]|nr:hypothetical protein [Paraburkholderia sp.]